MPQILGSSDDETGSNLAVSQKTFPNPHNTSTSQDQIPQHQRYAFDRSNFLVNNHFINVFNPKRASVDINSFIQVFRKKVRKTAIDKEFNNSLGKFNYNPREKMKGFAGKYKKMGQQTIQINRADQQLKKYIISDLEYKERSGEKRKSFSSVNGSSKRIQTSTSSFDRENKRKVKSKTRFKTTVSKTEDFASQSQRLTKHTRGKESNVQSHNMTTNVQKDKSKMSTNPETVLFSNGRLNSISSYQKPNLMYNLSLYRKKYPNIKRLQNNTSMTLEKKFQKNNLLGNNLGGQAESQSIQKNYCTTDIHIPSRKSSKRVITSLKDSKKNLLNQNA